MASFDPSVISKIPSYGPNPVGAAEQAYKLKDMIDQGQVRDFQLNQLKRQEDEENEQREILKNTDLSNPQGWMDASQKLAKAGYPDAAIAMQRQYQNMVSSGLKLTQGRQAIDQNRVKLLGAIANTVGPAAVTVKQTLQTKGIAMAQAQYQQMLPQLLQSVPADMAANIPRSLPGDPQQAMTLLNNAIAHSQQAQNVLKQQQGAQKLDIERQHEAAYEQNLARQGGTGFSPKASQILAEATAEGVSLPTGGSRSAKVVAQTFNSIAEQYPDLSPQQIVAKIKSGELSMTGSKTEMSAVARRQAGIETSAEEAGNVIPIAVQASKDVPRGKFVPLNKLIQGTQIATSDPKLAAFAQANLTLANVYARAMSPTGTPTVEGREEALKKLSVATSPEAYMAVVHVIQQEIDAANAAPGKIRSDVLRRAGATGEPPPATTAARTPPAATAAPGASNAPTATGPNGQRLILKNGQWVPLGQ